MNLVRFQKPAYMLSMNSLLNDFMNDYPNTASRSANTHSPAVNILDNEKAFTLEFLAPGFEKENFEIANKDGVLTVKGEAKQDENQTDNYTCKRFSIQSFERAFTLPENVDVESINAKYTNGILTIELPKKEVVVEDKIKNIPIQ